MAFRVPEPMVEPLAAGLVGLADVDGGPTGEQLAVLDALTAHLLGRPDLTGAGRPAGVGPAELAGALGDGTAGQVVRRRFHELAVAVEVCRHPQTPAQVERAEEYADALGVDGPDRAIFRDLVHEGVDRAAEDFRRFLDANLADRSEPSLPGPAPEDRSEPELVARLEAFAGMADGSLGRAYLRFYERSGLALPGREAAGVNHFYVSHDMTHVIAGIATTGPGEVALSAFQMAMDDNPVNTSALLASLVVHESGFERSPTVAAEAGILSRPGAAELLGREMARGAACTADFSLTDHFELAPLPLAEVRGRFGVRPPDDPDDGHHIW
ncbi:MAG: hypothetical protein ACOYOP_04810 [Microthrixaceae bacterium]